MISVYGDYFECFNNLPIHNDHAIAFTSNCMLDKNKQLVMGGGIALTFKQMFPNLPYKFGQHIQNIGELKYFQNPQVLHTLESYTIDEGFHNLIDVFAFPTKTDFKLDSTYKLVERSTKQLLFLLNSMNINKCLITPPGCGLGNLSWDKVKIILTDLDVNNKLIVISNV